MDICNAPGVGLRRGFQRSVLERPHFWLHVESISLLYILLSFTLHFISGAFFCKFLCILKMSIDPSWEDLTFGSIFVFVLFCVCASVCVRRGRWRRIAENGLEVLCVCVGGGGGDYAEISKDPFWKILTFGRIFTFCSLCILDTYLSTIKRVKSQSCLYLDAYCVYI